MNVRFENTLFNSIQSYNELESSMEIAVVNDDDELIFNLDAKLVQLWEIIHQYVPKNKNESKLLAQFLLQQLVSETNRTPMQSAACEKILGIVTSDEGWI